MQKIIKLLPVAMLCACTSRGPVEQQYVAIQNQIDAAKKTLPKECATPGVLATFDALSAQVKASEVICDATIKSEQTRTRNTTIIFSLLLLIYTGVLLFLLKWKLK